MSYGQPLLTFYLVIDIQISQWSHYDFRYYMFSFVIMSNKYVALCHPTFDYLTLITDIRCHIMVTNIWQAPSRLWALGGPGFGY